LLGRDDDYRSAGKPVCDYDDPQAREALVDALARHARALLAALDGRKLEAAVTQAAAVLAAVAGQDLDEGEDGVFRIARRVAKDRVISTVDPEARHGHKTAARGFDGYKGHVAVDPDSELITATTLTAGNVGDAAAGDDLLADDLPDPDPPAAVERPDADEPAAPAHDDKHAHERLAVYGDSAYGAGALLDTLQRADADIMCKVQPPVAPAGRYAKDAFDIDLQAGTVTCPGRPGHAVARATRRADRPLRRRVPGLPARRALHDLDQGPHDPRQTPRGAAHTRPQPPGRPRLEADYTATRPKVKRKIAHLMRRKHGGRRARVRGQTKIDADFKLLASAVNLARLAMLRLTRNGPDWTVQQTA
jgi:hypothetical protein